MNVRVERLELSRTAPIIGRVCRTVHQLANEGKAYEYDETVAHLALSSDYPESIPMLPIDWQLPCGAFKQGAGPQ